MDVTVWQKIFTENSFPCLILSKEFEIIEANIVAKRYINRLGKDQFLTDIFSVIDIRSFEDFTAMNSPEPHCFSVAWDNIDFIGQFFWAEENIVLLATPYIETQKKKNTEQTKDLLEDILHSIRNPLAVIQGRVDLMSLLTTDFNMQRYLRSISEQCQRIISVLEIAQTISNRPFRSTEFQLQNVVQDSLLLLRLDTDAPLDMDITIQNDQDRIKVIIFSILSMIKKFGVLKGIEVSKQNTAYDLCFIVNMSKEGMNLLYDIKTGTVRQAQKGNNYQLYSLQIALEDCGVKLDFEQNCIKLRFLYQGEIQEKQDRGKTILLVDDDQMLRETLVGLLSFDGYHIITSNSAEEALQQVDRDIDIVLMDVKLPGMSGVEFLEHIEETHPELVSKSILISGMEIETKGDIPFLQKPFSRALLTKTIDGVLSRTDLDK